MIPGTCGLGLRRGVSGYGIVVGRRGALGLCGFRDACILINRHMMVVATNILPLGPEGDDGDNVASQLRQSDDDHEELQSPEEHAEYLSPQHQRGSVGAGDADRQPHAAQGGGELEQRIATDGQLAAEHFSLDTVRMLEREIWGQGFPPPLFDDVFRVERQRVLKDKHLKLELSRAGQRFEAIRFNHADSAAGQIHAAYRLAINEYQGVASVQLMLEHFDSA